MAQTYRDRVEAGARLVEALRDYAGASDLVVLALPRGGLPVAAEVARALDAPLDLMLVRKLGVPGHEELAMGAIATGNVRVLNQDVVDQLNINEATLDRVTQTERQELQRREHAYRGTHPLPVVAGKRVILVDDGLATGASMRVAIKATQQQQPREVIVAVPVAPAETCADLREMVDDIVCPLQPRDFGGVGRWYDDFQQVSDDEVRQTLDEAWHRGHFSQP